MTTFADDILPLLTPSQIQCMAGKGVFLDDFAYMSDAASDDVYPDHAAARHVYARLAGTTEGPRMPLGGPFWGQDKLDLFQSWIEKGFMP
jgi:hypothetical protein